MCLFPTLYLSHYVSFPFFPPSCSLTLFDWKLFGRRSRRRANTNPDVEVIVETEAVVDNTNLVECDIEAGIAITICFNSFHLIISCTGCYRDYFIATAVICFCWSE